MRMSAKWLLVLSVVLLFSVVNAQEDLGFEVPPRGGEGTVVVKTDPPGSIVYLGGEELGKTPLETKFRSGRHDLLVIDQGQELVSTRFNVWPDSVNAYKTETVMPFGHVQVTTVPSKCDIYVDGDLADGTDGSYLTIRNLDEGSHTVKAVCGRKSKEVLVEVKGEETLKLTIDVNKKD